MNIHENHSEVARLMQQINEANEAAYQALEQAGTVQATITPGEVALPDPGSGPRANLDGMNDQENAERYGIDPH